jgi:hypothetical protein
MLQAKKKKERKKERRNVIELWCEISGSTMTTKYENRMKKIHFNTTFENNSHI